MKAKIQIRDIGSNYLADLTDQKITQSIYGSCGLFHDAGKAVAGAVDWVEKRTVDIPFV